MTEDEISFEMYVAADNDPRIQVLNWQGVGGKTYFYRDLRLVLPDGQKMKPDLILTFESELWIIEIKGSHAEARREDEPKLTRLRSQLADSALRQQVRNGLRGRFTISDDIPIRYAVAYSTGAAEERCSSQLAHLPWTTWRPELSAMLKAAGTAEHGPAG